MTCFLDFLFGFDGMFSADMRSANAFARCLLPRVVSWFSLLPSHDVVEIEFDKAIASSVCSLKILSKSFTLVLNHRLLARNGLEISNLSTHDVGSSPSSRFRFRLEGFVSFSKATSSLPHGGLWSFSSCSFSRSSNTAVGTFKRLAQFLAWVLWDWNGLIILAKNN